MKQVVRIGTRDSELALWQANTVKHQLHQLGIATELVPIKSTGDLVLDKPLYELGITGIFTKNLDVAMLNGEIDIAVHSMKDVPTQLPKGIVQGAVLQRANTSDVLVFKDNFDLGQTRATIATGSLRRKAQWLHRYPTHTVTDLRGNVSTRLKKLETNTWNGAIFAKAGLQRIDLLPKNHRVLDWMVPAPAQGAMMVAAMETDDFVFETLHHLNHKPTEICTRVERDFLRTLEGGCTAPIGASAQIDKGFLNFKGILCSLDGKHRVAVEKQIPVSEMVDAGKRFAEEVLQKGGKRIMEEINVNSPSPRGEGSGVRGYEI